MKDSPAIILASGLAGLLGAFCPTAKGWVLDQSLNLMGVELSFASLGILTVSKLLFLPAILLVAVGGLSMRKAWASSGMGITAVFLSLAALLAWNFERATIGHLSMVGIGPALGLFLLLVSGLGGLVGGLAMTIWPPVKSKD